MAIMHPIKVYRKHHKLDRYTFAAWVGVTYEAVRRWEKRKLRPGPKMAIKIERLTEGEIGRHELRPDLWPAPPERLAS